MKTFTAFMEARKMYDGGRAAKRGWDCGDCGAEKNRSDQCRSCGSPKRYHVVREDLASGRPAKKPVSSNLLKQRAKDNEKALKSGFMKMPDYVKKKFNEEEEKDYNPDKEHTMNPTSHVKKEGDKFCVYNMKGKKVASFDTKPQANAYAKKNHDQLMKEEKKNCGCGQDPCITYGKKEMKEAKKPVVHFKGEDKLKTVKVKYNKPIKTKVTDIGPGGKEHVVKDWSESVKHKILTELSPKTISSYQKKAGAQYRSLRKTTPSHQDSENAYHQGYTSDKEYFKQHDDRDKMKKRGKGLAMSKGKGVQKEMVSGFRHTDTDVSKKGTLHKSSHITPDRDGGKVADALNKHDRLKTIKKVAQKKNKLKEGAFKRKLTSKQEADRLNDRAHAALGYKKTSDSGLQKVKGGYERKRTYAKVKESSGDNYNPVISDKRTKEKLKKAGLPPESPKVQEGYYKRLATDAAEKLRMSKAKKKKEQSEKQINQPTMKEVQGHVYAGLLELTPTFMEGKKKGLDGKACWKGYKQMGTKKKGGKTVDNCVKMEEYTYESLNKLIGTTVDKVRGAIKDAEKKHGPVDPAKRKIPNPVSGENIAKRLYGKSQKKR